MSCYKCERCKTEESMFWWPIVLGERKTFLCDDCMLQLVLFMKRPFFKFGEVEEV